MTQRKRVTTSRQWIERGPLVPWMHLYAQWLVTYPAAELASPKGQRGKRTHHPSSEERQARASALAHKRIDRRLITLLERRPGFVEYFQKLRDDVTYRAREMLSRDLEENIEARREGLRHARGYVKTEQEVEGEKVIQEVYSPQAVDHKAIRNYTEWTTEVAFPKKAPEEGRAPRITINIESAEARRMIEQALRDDPIPEIEWEALPSKQLTDGTDD